MELFVNRNTFDIMTREGANMYIAQVEKNIKGGIQEEMSVVEDVIETLNSSTTTMLRTVSIKPVPNHKVARIKITLDNAVQRTGKHIEYNFMNNILVCPKRCDFNCIISLLKAYYGDLSLEYKNITRDKLFAERLVCRHADIPEKVNICAPKKNNGQKKDAQ